MELTSEQLQEIERAYYSGEKTQGALQKEYGIKEPIYKILPKGKSENLCPYCGVPMDIIKVSKQDYKWRGGKHIEECPQCGHSYDNCGYRNFKIDKQSYYSVDNRMFCGNCLKRIAVSISEKYGIKNFEGILKDFKDLSLQDKFLLTYFIEVSEKKIVKFGDKEYVQYKCSNKDMDKIKDYLAKHKLICVSWFDIYAYLACRIDDANFNVEPSSYVSCLLLVKNIPNYNAPFHAIDLCSSNIRNLLFDDFAHCLEECFIMWIIKRNEAWSSFDFAECRFAEKIKKYFPKYSFGNVASALYSMVSDFQVLDSLSFDDYPDEWRGLSAWFCESLPKALKNNSKDIFCVNEDQCSTFIRFIINNVDFGSQSLFDVVWGKIGKQNVQENNSDNKEILRRLDRIEKLLLELKAER